jgi:hypothetical protein
VVRLDVTPALDGVEAGLAEMAALERSVRSLWASIFFLSQSMGPLFLR